MRARTLGAALGVLALGLGYLALSSQNHPSQRPNPADASSPAINAPDIAEAPGGLISLGRPAYSSTGVAGHANDAEFGTAWTTPDSGWLAYDLSTIPSSRRNELVVAWHTSPDDGYTVATDLPICPVWSGRPYPRDFKIETNAAPGGRLPPTDGWVEAVAVRDNRNLFGQHLVDLDSGNWIRLQGSGPHGISVNMEVFDRKSVAGEGWLFTGDSITAAYAGHVTITNSDGASVGSLPELVAEKTDGLRRPLVQNGGTGCAGAASAVGFIEPMLDAFPGRYVTINFGGADGWGGSVDPETYYANLVSMVDHVVDRKLVPVVPTIPWPNNKGSWEAGIEMLNDQVRRLYRERSDVVPGPDLYSLTKDRPELYLGPGDVHLNDDGSSAARTAWAETMLHLGAT